jgi:segregation and condensation protein A
MIEPGAVDQLALNAYQFRLPTFEGPLDVLLRLIERDQLAITDVSLIAVTDQFLAHLATLAEQPPVLVAEFAAVGGRLVLLKSRSLLPRPPAAAEEPDPDDLVRQLDAYRALKAVSEQLALRDRTALGGFDRGEAIAVPEAPPPRLAIHQPALLARALRRRLTTVTGPVQAVAAKRIITIREMTSRLLTAVTGGATSFAAFRAGCGSREEVLVAFLSILVLVRRQVIHARQESLFGDITVQVAPAPNGPSPLPDGAHADTPSR